MFRKQATLQRLDMVGHEANVAALLCNLHPCHSGLPQMSDHDEYQKSFILYSLL